MVDTHVCACMQDGCLCKFLNFTLKIVLFDRKYIAKITNPITKPQFLTIIKLTYTGIK